LSSEQSDQWTVGLAWDATDWLNLTVDYYDIKIEDRIAAFSTGLIVNCLEGLSTCPPGVSELPLNVVPPQPGLGLGAAFDPNTGAVVYVQRGFANRGTLETNGVDMNLRTNFDMGAWGVMQNQLMISYVNDFSFDGGENLIGEPGYPEFRANLLTQLSYGDFTFAWNVQYIDGMQSYA